MNSCSHNNEYHWNILHDQVVSENGDIIVTDIGDDDADSNIDAACHNQRTLIQFVAQLTRKKS
jgi:hypothetical protein